MKEALKPCPFCGGENIIRSVDGGIWPEHLYAEMIAQNAFKKYVITCTLRCEDCGASIQGFAESNDPAEELYYKAIEDCYSKWDTERTCRMEASFTEPRELGFMQEYLCSECDEYAYLQIATDEDRLNYCPNCGAKVVE